MGDRQIDRRNRVGVKETSMLKELGPGFRLMVIFTVLTGFLYPAAITGVAALLFPRQASGSLVRVNGKVVGSNLIGQSFSNAEYFHPRPSSAGSGYDASASSGSNLGPSSAKLINGTTKMDDKGKEVVDYDGISLRIVHYCLDNGIAYDSSVSLDKFKNDKGDLDDVKLIKAFNDEKAPLVFTPKSSIPADAVTASASGLDPHISVAAAETQLSRVAHARGVSPDQIRSLIDSNTAGADFGILGEPGVNVLTLNVALDEHFPKK
jgi:K+-transporting ATPase ATPase C chain